MSNVHEEILEILCDFMERVHKVEGYHKKRAENSLKVFRSLSALVI